MSVFIVTEKSFFGYKPEITDPAILELCSKPPRNPCEYCNKIHLDYACDKQLEFIKTKLKIQ